MKTMNNCKALLRAALLAAICAVAGAGSIGCSDDSGTDVPPPPPPTDSGNGEACVFDSDGDRCSETTTNLADSCSPYVTNCTRFNNCRVPGYPNNVPVVP
jgi:hypothetical protein